MLLIITQHRSAMCFTQNFTQNFAGRIMDDLIHVIDWFDTFEDIISDGYSIKPKYKIKKRHRTDGISQWKAIKKGFYMSLLLRF